MLLKTLMSMFTISGEFGEGEKAEAQEAYFEGKNRRIACR